MIAGPASWLRIYIGEADRWQGKPLHLALVELFRREGLAGATVLRGVEGFGAHSRLHTFHLLRLSEDLPLVVEVVDQPEKIAAILPRVSEMVREGLVMTSEVQVAIYRHGQEGSG